MYIDYINEAFKNLDLLTEDMFDTSSVGINNLSRFMTDDDEIDEVRVIDTDASNEDDIQDSYIGKVIINCNVCHSHVFEDKDEIVLADEGFANMDVPCPYCGQTEGFTIVGEIAEFNKDATETSSLENSNDEQDDTSVETEVSSEDMNNRDIVESVEPVLTETHKYKPHTVRLLKLIGSDLVNDVVSEDVEDCDSADCKLEEDFKEVSITTDDQHLEMTSDDSGKVSIVTEPIEANMDGDMIVPLSAETESDIIENNEETPAEDIPAAEDALIEDTPVEGTPDDSFEDVDFEDIDETTVDELGESYLKRVYENVDSFKTSDVFSTETGIIIEGVIGFTSGSKKKTRFMFESADMNEDGQIRFIGTNKHLTESKDAFSLVGKVSEKKLVIESLKYNYATSGSNVRGVVRRK